MPDVSAGIKTQTGAPQRENYVSADQLFEFNLDCSRASAGPKEHTMTTQLPSGLRICQIAPHWTQPDVKGGKHTLSQSLGASGLLLTFVRGMFCPYCTEQLHQLWEGEAQFYGRGITSMVIAAYGPEALAVSAALAGTRMPILIDSGRQVIDAYNIRHDDPDFIERDYPTGALVHPTTVLLDAARIVRWMYIGAKYNDRPKLHDVLAQIDQIRQPA
jgi:peroxiredoxin